MTESGAGQDIAYTCWLCCAPRSSVMVASGRGAYGEDMGRCGSCVILQFSMKMITPTCCTQLREKVALLLRFCTDLHAVRSFPSPYPYVAIRISPFISAQRIDSGANCRRTGN